jgi:3-oxoacyl-[acyl-carrier protein] reductase
MMRALVFGPTGGIGGNVCTQLRARGVDVHGCDRRAVDGPGSTSLDLAAAVRDATLVDWMSDWTRTHGMPEYVAWCIGVYDRSDLVEYCDERLLEVLHTNLTSMLLVLKGLLTSRTDQGASLRFVAVGSQAGATGGRDPVYAASKAGIVAAVKSVAREYARAGLMANVVSPGPTDTPMTSVMGDRRQHYESSIPLGRFNRPDEVASVVTWLLLDAPESLTGTVVDVDGGLVRR